MNQEDLQAIDASAKGSLIRKQKERQLVRDLCNDMGYETVLNHMNTIATDYYSDPQAKKYSLRAQNLQNYFFNRLTSANIYLHKLIEEIKQRKGE